MRKRRRNKRGLQSKKGETVTGRLGDKDGVRIIKKIHMNDAVQKKRYILYFYFELLIPVIKFHI